MRFQNVDCKCNKISNGISRWNGYRFILRNLKGVRKSRKLPLMRFRICTRWGELVANWSQLRYVCVFRVCLFRLESKFRQWPDAAATPSILYADLVKVKFVNFVVTRTVLNSKRWWFLNVFNLVRKGSVNQGGLVSSRRLHGGRSIGVILTEVF